MINSNWSKWCYRSICKHFDSALTIPIVYTGQPTQVTDSSNFVELRIDGPYITELSKDYFRLYYEVNILHQYTRSETNIYNRFNTLGNIQAAFTTITVYDDEDNIVGCMTLDQDLRDRQRVQTNDFGQIDPDVDILQATVEGHYILMMEN